MKTNPDPRSLFPGGSTRQENPLRTSRSPQFLFPRPPRGNPSVTRDPIRVKLSKTGFPFREFCKRLPVDGSEEATMTSSRARIGMQFFAAAPHYAAL